MNNNQNEGAVSFRIIRGQLDSLSLYEITDHELEIFEEGFPSSTFLNFAIFFFSIGMSFLITLLTVKIEVGPVLIIFVGLTMIGIAASLVLFMLWYKTKSRVEDLVKKIKGRVPTVPVKDPVDSIGIATGITESNG